MLFLLTLELVILLKHIITLEVFSCTIFSTLILYFISLVFLKNIDFNVKSMNVLPTCK